jgi:hypothetical protein
MSIGLQFVLEKNSYHGNDPSFSEGEGPLNLDRSITLYLNF